MFSFPITSFEITSFEFKLKSLPDKSVHKMIEKMDSEQKRRAVVSVLTQYNGGLTLNQLNGE